SKAIRIKEFFRGSLENDTRRLELLLERLRDDLIHNWHSVQVYEEEPIYADPESVTTIRANSLKYRDDHFLPALQRLTLLGLLIVKYSGSVKIFEQTIYLLRDTYNISNELQGLRWVTPRGSSSQHIGDHISHTTPALHCIIGAHIIGAYVTSRRRFDYIPAL
ncbi:MAG: hypothetical protein ACLPM3_01070, partial [Terracidiphilus sp.]